MKKIRILLVDDSKAFLDGVAHFLATEPILEVVGRAYSGEQAISDMKRLSPDLIFMDLNMPVMNGIDATRLIKSQAKSPKVIMLTLYDTKEHRAASTLSGADGFISKSEFVRQALDMIKDMFSSDPVLVNG